MEPWQRDTAPYRHHPCRHRILALICTAIASGMVWFANHAGDAGIPAWSAAVIGGIAAVIPHYIDPYNRR